MATFNNLDPTAGYLITCCLTGHSKGDGISGADAMAQEWEEGDEAWPAGETEFRGRPVETAMDLAAFRRNYPDGNGTES